MNRAQKEEFVTDLSGDLQNAQVFALLSFTKITVEQMTSFRLSLGKQNCQVRVVKNTLAKRVLGATPHKDICKDLKGPTLLVFSEQDPVLAAKAVMEWVKKENFQVKVKSGVALGQLMSSMQIESLSKLPGRNELLVSFLWALKSHPTGFLYALKDTPQRLGYALHALKTKKETEAKN